MPVRTPVLSWSMNTPNILLKYNSSKKHYHKLCRSQDRGLHLLRLEDTSKTARNNMTKHRANYKREQIVIVYPEKGSICKYIAKWFCVCLLQYLPQHIFYQTALCLTFHHKVPVQRPRHYGTCRKLRNAFYYIFFTWGSSTLPQNTKRDKALCCFISDITYDQFQE